MPKNSYAEIINSAKLMISGLKEHNERMQKRGLDNEFIAQFEDNYKSVQMVDNEQEILKAALKTKTTELNNKLEQLKSLQSEAQKIVKVEMEQPSWRSFGITASR
jgi:hypothetical protein